MRDRTITRTIKISNISEPPFVYDAEILFILIFPDKKILLHTKSYYPDNAYRLPTGAMEWGENPEDALKREVKEETGIDVDNGEFLTKIIYTIDHPGGEKTFTTYIFLVETENRGYKPIDIDEKISGFKEVEINELPNVADKLRNLKSEKEFKKWDDWGRFRSISHDVIYRVLSERK